MLQSFQSFIKNKNLFQKNLKILLAVSGGVDSIAMCELFHQAKLRFGIAHCNFRLRGDESDGDEVFVRSLAKKYQVPFFLKQFSTADYATDNSVSIQMAARDLRYEWFEEVRKKEGFSFIATAHHLDDQVETFFVNLMKNSGIAGFHGIPVKSGYLVRPMMFATRKEIITFVKASKLNFREDSSNKEIKYLRNHIRRKAIPLLNKIQPGFDRIINETIERIAGTEQVYRQVIETRRKEIITEAGSRSIIPIGALRDLSPLGTYLYEFLAPFGFNYAVVEEIIRSLKTIPGKTFYSPTHILVRDRDQLLIEPLPEKGQEGQDKNNFLIHKDQDSISHPVHLVFRIQKNDSQLHINESKSFASLDASKLTYPLVLRKWEPGDVFFPFGKKIRKKLSDFFIDEKISLLDKKRTWLLCSENKIVWVVGHRIDNRFRVTSKTAEVLVVEWKK